ncbi:MAG: hypothetical protein CVU39_12275 [Chloroflexi bacterium HGW-Chloroflexi-10]|nr:MAG: hypothetical protein CVU39_12275 [Chloroflexi bacterium HGW-Chloroflexi-10]
MINPTCPFLGLLADPQTHSLSADVPNYCHKFNPPQRVNEEQLAICLKGMQSTRCTYAQENARQNAAAASRPRVWFARHHFALGFTAWAGLVFAVLTLSAVILGWFEVPTAPAAQAARATFTPSETAAAALQPHAPTGLPTGLPTPEITPSQTPSPTPTSSLTPSSTPTEEQAGGGYALGEAFNLDGCACLMRKVEEDESLAQLAEHYQTSAEVIQQMNRSVLKEGRLWMNTVIVLCPGERNAADASAVRAIPILVETTLEQVSIDWDVSVQDLATWNNLTDGQRLTPGGYLMIVGQ